MAKIKLTKSAVDAAQPQAKAIELRDTVVPGFELEQFRRLLAGDLLRVLSNHLGSG